MPTAAKPLSEAQVRREITRRLIAIEKQIVRANDANGLARHLLGELHLFFDKWEADVRLFEENAADRR